MTKLLKKALEATKKLTDAEQNTIAALILEELADEERWNHSFARTQKQLSTLAKEALAEYKGGRTKPLAE
jgi:aspartate/glutamate racemase